MSNVVIFLWGKLFLFPTKKNSSGGGKSWEVHTRTPPHTHYINGCVHISMCPGVCMYVYIKFFLSEEAWLSALCELFILIVNIQI